MPFEKKKKGGGGNHIVWGLDRKQKKIITEKLFCEEAEKWSITQLILKDEGKKLWLFSLEVSGRIIWLHRQACFFNLTIYYASTIMQMTQVTYPFVNSQEHL